MPSPPAIEPFACENCRAFLRKRLLQIRRLTQTPYKSGCPCYPRYRGLKGTDADSAERVCLPFRVERAVALVEINGRTDARDLKGLAPATTWKSFGSFDHFVFGFKSCSRRIRVGHRFSQDSTI